MPSQGRMPSIEEVWDELPPAHSPGEFDQMYGDNYFAGPSVSAAEQRRRSSTELPSLATILGRHVLPHPPIEPIEENGTTTNAIHDMEEPAHMTRATRTRVQRPLEN